MTASAPADAEAQARCAFGAARLARCVVEVTGAAGRSQRRAEIPYRDAEDLAESLALLVSDVLTADFPNIVGRAPARPPRAKPPVHAPGREPPSAANGPPPAPNAGDAGAGRTAANAPQARAPEITPAPSPPPLDAVPPLPPVAPPPLPPRDDEAAVQARLRAERAHQEALATAAERAERGERAERNRRAAAAAVAQRANPPQPRVTVAGGVVGVFGLAGNNPVLVGGTAGVGYARGLLRLSSTLSLAGIRETRDGHPLSFFRGLVAARAGLGVTGTVVDFDITAGPALAILSTDARGADSHALASFALVAGPRVALTVWGPLALVIGADLDFVVTEEKIMAGSVTVAQLSRFGLEAGIALAWRSGWKASASTPLTP
jgi:hypothetical protein